MFIFWGTTIKRKALGRVGDYCTICRGPRPFTLTRVGAATHFYGISFGQGSLVGYEASCEKCETPMDADAQEYAAVATSEIPDFRTLVEKTNPGLKGLASERSELDSQVRSGRSNAEERKSHLMEPFFLLNGMVEQQSSAPRVSPLGRKLILGAGAVSVIGLAVPAIVGSGSDAIEAGLMVFAGGLFLALVAAIGFRMTAMRWFMRSEIEPRLVRSLRTLDPSHEELDDVRVELRALKLRIGRKFDAKRLFESLQLARTQPGAGSA